MNVAQHIVHLYSRGDAEGLRDIKKVLNEHISEYDKFFDEYLEVFSTQMDASNQSEPVWKAYQDKYKAYQVVKSNIKQCDYYLGML